MNIVEKAKMFALEKHAGQKYGSHDYSYHLQGVADLVSDNTSKAIAWLHDTMEDCNVSFAELNEEFGFEITACVKLLTKVKDTSYFDYIISIQKNKCHWHRAHNVKIADLKFNIKESESRKLNGYEKQRLDKYKLTLYILEH